MEIVSSEAWKLLAGELLDDLSGVIGGIIRDPNAVIPPLEVGRMA